MAGSLLTLVISIAAYDWLTGLIERYRPIGIAALVLTGLLALMVLAQLVRELWAFRRLARIDAFRSAAAEAHATADRDAAIALSDRLASFYGGRAELRWHRSRLAEQRADLLDADAILELTERSLFASLDASARREVEVAARTVAAATAMIPLALLDVLAALSTNVRMVRRIADIYGAHADSSARGVCSASLPPTCSPPARSRSATT